jgi:radical SAM superfamily enzyme YgiQ (UPF0313 family)
LLSDNLSNPILGDSRYMAPYALASQLEAAGFDVAVIDYFTRLSDFFSVLDRFLDSSTLFIGISTTFLSHTLNSARIGNEDYRDILLSYHNSLHGSFREALRNKYDNTGLWLPDRNALHQWLISLKAHVTNKSPDCKIVLGGSKARLFVNEAPGWDDFDYLALSASDFSIVQLAQRLKYGQAPQTYQLNGHHILDNRQELKSKYCPESFFQSKHAVRAGEALPIEISRGCIYNCKFCHYDKKESLRKDLSTLKTEFIRNYEQFGSTVYHFCDDCFNDSRKKVEETCNAILSLPFAIEWVSFVRVDISIRFPETLDLMIASGASGLFWGIESFNQKAAFLAGKRIPPPEVKQFLLEAYAKHSEKCLFEGSFIVGLPGETPTSIQETTQWLTSHRALDFVNASPMYLLPFQKELDSVTIDYADFSRRPSEYGISFDDSSPDHWRHDSMTSADAVQLSHALLKAWTENGHSTALRSIFDYPNLRTLGFSKTEILEMGRHSQGTSQWMKEIMKRFHSFVQDYERSLEPILHPMGSVSPKMKAII